MPTITERARAQFLKAFKGLKGWAQKIKFKFNAQSKEKQLQPKKPEEEKASVVALGVPGVSIPTAPSFLGREQLAWVRNDSNNLWLDSAGNKLILIGKVNLGELQDFLDKAKLTKKFGEVF